jgi:Spy/CpxP family protein refolding chaperone
MIRLTLATAVIVCSALAGQAPAPPAQARLAPLTATYPGLMAQMKARLQLTPEQVKQIKPVLQAQREQRQQIQANTQSFPGARQLRARKLRELRAETDSKIEAILKPAQRPEFHRILDEQRERARVGRARSVESH